MPYIAAYFHIVWATKNRYPYLSGDIRTYVFEHIRQNARLKNIYLDCINGFTDHAHCIISLSSDQTIRKTVQLIKGESSFWINKEKLCGRQFEWQDEYYAVSVSPPDLQKVRAYIYNQEKHHRSKTFQEEYNELVRDFGFPLAAM